MSAGVAATSPKRWALDGGGRVLLFQPLRDGLDTLVTRVLKAWFFEAVFNDPIRAGGGPDLPLLGCVADEFHQFVTSDRVHGDAPPQ